ncbi:MAG: hypothetical protein KVP17_001349 [Porospora cf. gigantea B]|uniref:uncharacterized protein n=2 Tax=Porospora cf. gigantea B TaxID=2853592 RepID=UPI0035719ABA|nr:MAG: hypothetical protein KVP17_001349 [Porospora cf. gigantea B]
MNLLAQKQRQQEAGFTEKLRATHGKDFGVSFAVLHETADGWPITKEYQAMLDQEQGRTEPDKKSAATPDVKAKVAAKPGSKPKAKPKSKPGKGAPKKGGVKGLMSRKKATPKAASKIRKLHWDIVDTDEGTVWKDAEPSAVDIGDVAETFAKAERKEAPKTEVKKPTVIQLIKDPKRAQSMNIGVARFAKNPLQDLRKAIVGLDPDVLDEQATDTLIRIAPEPAEYEMVKDFLDGGGQVEELDKPEQFVAAMKGIPLFAERLEAHMFALQFQENLSPLRKQLDLLESTIDTLRGSDALLDIFAVILEIGNKMNQSSVKGFRLSTLSKLGDVKTSTKPLRTITHYITDLLWSQNRNALDLVDDFKDSSSVVRMDKSAQEAGVAALKAGVAKIKRTVELGEKIDAKDPLVVIMGDFVGEISPLVQVLDEDCGRIYQYLLETAIYFGEKESNAKKMTAKEVFQPVVKFVNEVGAVLKDLKAQELKAEKRRELEAKRAGAKKGAKAGPAKKARRPDDLPDIGQMQLD